jgi:hypothetical protein
MAEPLAMRAEQKALKGRNFSKKLKINPFIQTYRRKKLRSVDFGLSTSVSKATS